MSVTVIKATKAYYTNNGNDTTVNRVYGCKSKVKIVAYIKVWLAVQCHKYLALMLKLEGCEHNKVGQSSLIERLPICCLVDKESGAHYVRWYGGHCKNYPSEMAKGFIPTPED